MTVQLDKKKRPLAKSMTAEHATRRGTVLIRIVDLAPNPRHPGGVLGNVIASSHPEAQFGTQVLIAAAELVGSDQ